MDSDWHEEIARCLFRESNDALFLFDPEAHRVLDLNPLAIRLTGFTKDQARSLRLWDLFRGESAAGIDRLIDAYRRTGFYHSREGFNLNRRAADPIPVNVSVSRMHTQPRPLGLVVVRDVTERKRAEAALRESEGRYRRLIESAGVVIWSASADGRIASLNRQFQTLTGWEIEPWIGRPLLDLVLTEDRPRLFDLVENVRRGNSPPPVELRVARQDGSIAMMEFLSTTPLDEGPLPELTGIARDVTGARQAAEALARVEEIERARVAAEMADRAKSAFLANFSHEIRTPLTAILGFTDLLLTDDHVATLPPERREDLQIIGQNGSHLLSLINDILDLSEIEAGKIRLVPTSCSPRSIAGEVVASLMVKAEAKGLSLSIEPGEKVPQTIVTDPVRLRQILINLVGNAIKFTARGSVTLRIEVRETTLDFEVEDTGVGLNSEQISHLFEPFYRTSVRDASGSGNGLGLAISRRLAESLGGTLSVTSEPDRGSTFVLKLPLPPVEREPRVFPQRPAKSEEPQKRLAGLHILLAEDNPAIQRVTALHLEKFGATTALARNGQEAIDLVEASLRGEKPFDCVLIDMQMPVLDGYEATSRLREIGYRGVLIALTAYAMLEDREECIRLGCDDHLSKPIDWELLVETITHHLGKQNQPTS